MLWKLIVRILKSLLEILVLIDQAICLLISIPIYIVCGHPIPNADDTISSRVGYYAAQGQKWALACEWVIDRLFYIPSGFRLGHCRDKIEQNEKHY